MKMKRNIIADNKFCGYYNYTVVLTYMGMILGFLGMTFIVKEMYREAILCIMGSGFCDMFDGTVAATKVRNNMEKQFGIQIDSLSDLICFGVLPALFIYKISGENVSSVFIGSFYLLCGLIRLAYYNVTEEERQKKEDGSRKYFTGLPITSAAMILPICYLVENLIQYGHGTISAGIIAITGLLFIAPIAVPKPKTFGKILLLIIGLFEFLSVFFSEGIYL